MGLVVGSARIDENGKISGGALGDNNGREVSTQPYYLHSKGWYVLRPKTIALANGLASAMTDACANNHIGYDQSNRYGESNQRKDRSRLFFLGSWLLYSERF